MHTSPKTRISTGVKGLDELIEGGLIPGRVYLVTGPPGSGKTTLALQFLLEGAKHGEKGLYVSLIQKPEEVIKDMAKYDPSIFAYVKAWKIMLYDLGPILWRETSKVPTWGSVLSRIKELSETEKIDRLVIDPVTAIEFSVSNPAEKRAELARFIRGLEDLGTTAYLVAEMTDMDRYTEEHYLTSGVIMMHYFMHNNKMVRAIQILKMRGTKHNTDMKKIVFSDNGIIVLNKSPFEDEV
ncbi:MAG: AAA family ATPase [Thermococcus sp.]|uniref:RAD55 family ATPase n=1 Tax=Thermococcus sp. TaxID=35749 RepID=UPI001DD547CE|nr:RAD55 family ATPase [Thermococcus sp.]MBO8175014.1 AAA family ATPase [Thermococcus sp.]